ncbi:Type II secretion system protein F [compost metagenome]
MSFDLSTIKEPRAANKGLSFDSNIQFGKKFNDKKKELFYRELGMLLKSGVDFKKALEIISQQTKNKNEKEIIVNIKDKVVEGKSIYEAMMTSGHFSPYEYYSVQIGEETRKLEEVLSELQKYFTRKIQMKRQIVSVLTYPCIVLVVTFLVLYFMLTKVVPMFSSVFRQFGSELPASTQYIIKISNNSGAIFTSLGIVIVGLIITHFYFKNKDGYREFISGLVLKIPYIGNLIRKIYLSRFCQSMNLLITSRTTLINSLSLTSKMIGFYPIEKSIEAIKEDITKGASLSSGLRKHDVYEDKMVSMIEVAEQVNQLDIMFERLSEQYNEDINHQTKMIGVVLEPLIIIIIGLVVGVIMISMYAPMFDLSKILTK